jgi:hypothetical protein
MVYGRIVVPLSTDERGALIKIAEVECRDPRDQLRYMLREEAQRRGLIECETVLKASGRPHGDEHTRDDQDSALTPES